MHSAVAVHSGYECFSFRPSLEAPLFHLRLAPQYAECHSALAFVNYSTRLLTFHPPYGNVWRLIFCREIVGLSSRWLQPLSRARAHMKATGLLWSRTSRHVFRHWRLSGLFFLHSEVRCFCTQNSLSLSFCAGSYVSFLVGRIKQKQTQFSSMLLLLWQRRAYYYR